MNVNEGELNTYVYVLGMLNAVDKKADGAMMLSYFAISDSKAALQLETET